MMTLEQLDKEFYRACHEVSCLNVPTEQVVRMLRNLNISRMQAASLCTDRKGSK